MADQPSGERDAALESWEFIPTVDEIRMPTDNTVRIMEAMGVPPVIATGQDAQLSRSYHATVEHPGSGLVADRDPVTGVVTIVLPSVRTDNLWAYRDALMEAVQLARRNGAPEIILSSPAQAADRRDGRQGVLFERHYQNEPPTPEEEYTRQEIADQAAREALRALDESIVRDLGSSLWVLQAASPAPEPSAENQAALGLQFRDVVPDGEVRSAITRVIRDGQLVIRPRRPAMCFPDGTLDLQIILPTEPPPTDEHGRQLRYMDLER